MIPIIRSLSITFIVASLVGLVFWSIGEDFVKPFVLTIILQFVVFWIFNTCSGYIYNLKLAEIQITREAEFTKQGIEVGCAYCRTVNFIPIRFDDDNDFKCTSCDKANAVYIGVTVTQKTTPLNINSISVNTIDHGEQQAIGQLTGQQPDSQDG